jgi:hypothetical protein
MEANRSRPGGLQPWIDFAHAENPFQNGEAPFQSAGALTTTDWALAVSLTIWGAVPLLLGTRRLLRVEVK